MATDPIVKIEQTIDPEGENRQRISEEVAEALRMHYKTIGKRGGEKTKAKMKGSAYYSMIGKRGAERRWRKQQHES